jgi:hypothetical protein
MQYHNRRLEKEIVMKTFKVMVRDNLTGELTFSKKGMSIENAQQELFSHVGRMLIENGFERSGSYSENKVTLARSGVAKFTRLTLC